MDIELQRKLYPNQYRLKQINDIKYSNEAYKNEQEEIIRKEQGTIDSTNKMISTEGVVMLSGVSLINVGTALVNFGTFYSSLMGR